MLSTPPEEEVSAFLLDLAELPIKVFLRTSHPDAQRHSEGRRNRLGSKPRSEVGHAIRCARQSWTSDFGQYSDSEQ